MARRQSRERTVTVWMDLLGYDMHLALSVAQDRDPEGHFLDDAFLHPDANAFTHAILILK